MKKTPRLTVIAVAYKRYLQIPILIHSFLCQSSQDWELHIYHDGYDKEHEAIVKPYQEKYPEKIHYHYSKKRYNDWGHSLREKALETLPLGEWTLLTNDDNYYVPIFVESVLNAANSSPDTKMIYFDCIQRTKAKNSHSQEYYGLQQSIPVMLQIDMGSFVTRSDIFKSVKFESKAFIADGIFIETLIKTYPDAAFLKLNQCLFVHN